MALARYQELERKYLDGSISPDEADELWELESIRGQFDTSSVDAGNGGVPYRDSESWNRLLEKSVDGGIIKSGRSGALNPDSDGANSHAERYYGLVRKMTTDVQRIAKNTGFSASDIQSIKDFIFCEEHELDGGVIQRFDPCYEMAESWQRLVDGKEIMPHDITLLRHERMERSLMLQGVPQDEAHMIATKKYDYGREAKLYHDKVKKHKK